MPSHLKFIKVKEAYEAFVSNCVTIRSGLVISKAIEKLLDNPTVHSIYVVNKQGKLVGAIHIRDLIRVTSARYQIRGKGFGTFINYLKDVMKDSVDDVMHPPMKVKLDDDLSKALKIMESYNLSTLPVVDAKNKVIGELSGSEILKFAIEGVRRTEEKLAKEKVRREKEKEKKKRKK